MNTITATELRTKTKDLMEALLKGEEVSLIHRSRVIGVFKPRKKAPKLFNAKEFTKIAEKMNLPKLSREEREKRYRNAMMKKHGKSIY